MAVRSEPKYFGRKWCGLDWSPWTAFSKFRASILPIGPGLYRVRPRGKQCLAYIGETGMSLRNRLSTLRNQTLKSQMPFNDPHTAAPNLWAWRQSMRMDFECSAAECDLTRNGRRGLEHHLIWQYRRKRGESPLCNLGRFHPHYSKSRGRTTGKRGRRLPAGKRNPAGEKSAPPLRGPVRNPKGTRWMGLHWSRVQDVAHLSEEVPESPGIYKIFDPGKGELLYIGQSYNLRSRLRAHVAKKMRARNRQVWFTRISIPKPLRKHHLLELENDLLGAYYSVNRKHKLPRLQVGQKS